MIIDSRTCQSLKNDIHQTKLPGEHNSCDYNDDDMTTNMTHTYCKKHFTKHAHTYTQIHTHIHTQIQKINKEKLPAQQII